MKNEVVTCSYRDKENEASRSCVSHFWERQNGRIILWNKQIVCIVKEIYYYNMIIEFDDNTVQHKYRFDLLEFDLL
jgi:hypothetical protein